MAHCRPLLDRPSACWIWVGEIETIVWSMKVMATAKIIGARIRLRDRPPPVLLNVSLPGTGLVKADSCPVRHLRASHQSNDCSWRPLTWHSRAMMRAVVLEEFGGTLDLTGVVEEAGPGVRDFAAGDEVYGLTGGGGGPARPPPPAPAVGPPPPAPAPPS